MSLPYALIWLLIILLAGCVANQTTPPSPTPLPVSTVTPILMISPSRETGPTALPSTPGTDPNAQQVGATLVITSNTPTVRSGETITVTGVLSGMGLPQYSLYLKDEPAIIVRYDNEIVFQGFTGEQVEFISAEAAGSQVQFVLRALQPGEVQIKISASGEVAVGGGQGQPPAWAWGNAASDNLIVQIER
jgi:hypothetical protein